MTTLRTSSGPAPARAGVSAPTAMRVQAPGWRDPRLVVGVVIVAACVLLGARVLAGADDTVAVWSVRHDLPAGSALDGDDLVAARVHFTGDGADRYLLATTDPAPGSTVLHDVAAGELLPRSAVAAGGGPELVEVPLSLAPDDLPASVRRGAVVDVWVTPTVTGAGAGEDRARARLALDDVVVVAVPAPGDSLAPRTTQQVIVGVDASQADDLADALGQLADGRIVLTRQAGS
jgi:hypothetical protein